MKKIEPYIDADGEVRELDEHFFASAKRGRPTLPSEERKKRVNLTLDVDLIAKAKADGIKLSTRVNELLRADLGV